MQESIESNTKWDKRLIRTEISISCMQDDIREIKRTNRWILGLIFSLNSTIIGLLMKLTNIV